MAEPLAIAFGAVMAGITAVLLASYVSFVRMNPDIRRARLFLMARRIHRFLLAFTVGFLAITATLMLNLAGASVPPGAGTAIVFFFLGATLYGSLEVLFIARPRATLFTAGPRETPSQEGRGP